jgi:hypothetical protein
MVAERGRPVYRSFVAIEENTSVNKREFRTDFV